MLEKKALQAIGILLDEKLEKKLDEKFDEMAMLVNKGFTGMQKEFDGLKEEFNEVKGELREVKKDIKFRPTLNQIMSWGDKKIVALELDMDKVKYLHQKEFAKLPPQAEISRTLIERGFKVKEAKV